MALTLDKLAGPMLTAALPHLAEGGGAALTFLEQEIETLAKRMLDIAKSVAAGDFDADTGKVLLSMQVNLTVGALAVATNIAEAAIQQAVNAALKVGLEILEGALGLALPFPL
ncbi:hypothetical protein ACTL6U_19550 [Rhodovibrionaceae bacterium A322]